MICRNIYGSEKDDWTPQYGDVAFEITLLTIQKANVIIYSTHTKKQNDIALQRFPSYI